MKYLFTSLLGWLFLLLFFTSFSRDDHKRPNAPGADSIPGPKKSYQLVDSCIVLDTKNCCANTAVPLYIKENARVSVKIINVNPLAARMPAITTSSDTIDFGDFPTVFSLKFDNDGDKTTLPANNVIDSMNLPVQIGYSKKSKSQRIKVKNPDTSGTAAAAVRFKACYESLLINKDSLQRFLNLEPRIKAILATPIAGREDLEKRIAWELYCFKDKQDSCCCWYQQKYAAWLKAIFSYLDCLKEQYAVLTKSREPDRKVAVSGSIKIDGRTVDLKQQDLVLKGGDTVPTPFDEAFTAMVKFSAGLGDDSTRKAMDKKVQQLTNMCNDLKTAGPFSICRNLDQASGDTYTINGIRIMGPGANDTAWQMPAMHFFTYGGHRLNFSTGVGFSFFGLDKAYFKEKNASDSSSFTIKKAGGSNWVLPSVAAFIHSYTRQPWKKWQPAWTFGISTSPANIESTRFFAGASLIRGQTRRFIISAGVTAGPAAVLKGKFADNQSYKYADYSGIEDADLTEKKLRINAFIGISYNLSAKR